MVAQRLIKTSKSFNHSITGRNMNSMKLPSLEHKGNPPTKLSIFRCFRILYKGEKFNPFSIFSSPLIFQHCQIMWCELKNMEILTPVLHSMYLYSISLRAIDICIQYRMLCFNQIHHCRVNICLTCTLIIKFHVSFLDQTMVYYIAIFILHIAIFININHRWVNNYIHLHFTWE